MAASSGRALRLAVKKCLRNVKKCDLGITVVIVGQQHPNQLQHVADAISGNGENMGGPLSPILTYQGQKNRKSWPKGSSPRGLPSCNKGSNLSMAIRQFGGDVDCDEYPFNVAKEGGYGNYRKGRVSARFIPRAENQNFGATMSGLGRGKNKLKAGDKFAVIPAPFSPVSVTIKSSKKR